MIRRMKHYCNCVTCKNFGVAYQIKTYTGIDTIICKECLEKLIDKVGKE